MPSKVTGADLVRGLGAYWDALKNEERTMRSGSVAVSTIKSKSDGKKKKVHGPKARDGRTQKVISRYYDEIKEKQPGKSKEYYARVAWQRYCMYKNPDYAGCTKAGKTKAVSGPVGEEFEMDLDELFETAAGNLSEAARYDFGGMDPQKSYERSMLGLNLARDVASKMKAPGARKLINGVADFGHRYAKEFDRGGVSRGVDQPRTPVDLYNLLVAVKSGLNSAFQGWKDKSRAGDSDEKRKFRVWIDAVGWLMVVVDTAMNQMYQWSKERSEGLDSLRNDLLEKRGGRELAGDNKGSGHHSEVKYAKSPYTGPKSKKGYHRAYNKAVRRAKKKDIEKRHSEMDEARAALLGTADLVENKPERQGSEIAARMRGEELDRLRDDLLGEGRSLYEPSGAAPVYLYVYDKSKRLVMFQVLKVAARSIVVRGVAAKGKTKKSTKVVPLKGDFTGSRPVTIRLKGGEATHPNLKLKLKRWAGKPMSPQL